MTLRAIPKKFPARQASARWSSRSRISRLSARTLKVAQTTNEDWMSSRRLDTVDHAVVYTTSSNLAPRAAANNGMDHGYVHTYLRFCRSLACWKWFVGLSVLLYGLASSDQNLDGNSTWPTFLSSTAVVFCVEAVSLHRMSSRAATLVACCTCA